MKEVDKSKHFEAMHLYYKMRAWAMVICEGPDKKDRKSFEDRFDGMIRSFKSTASFIIDNVDDELIKYRVLGALNANK